jgi:hypothetical protein
MWSGLSSSTRRLRGVEKLTSSERSLIADCLVPREYADGEVIIKQGERGDSFYLVEQARWRRQCGSHLPLRWRLIAHRLAQGEAEALQTHNGAEVVVGVMKQGDYFGERALITLEPRAATVRAKGPLKVGPSAPPCVHAHSVTALSGLSGWLVRWHSWRATPLSASWATAARSWRAPSRRTNRRKTSWHGNSEAGATLPAVVCSLCRLSVLFVNWN